ncbi:MAG: hypothetical protein OEW75_19075, partial [Cyclobacteriaceae bacterium]|nr:hypothetical protein [Cyclobacteriaceae bacterium]
MYKFLFYLLFFITLSNYGNSQELNFTTPIKLPETINTPYEESVPQYNSKTKTLFFSRSFYPKNEGGIKAGSDIWYSKFKNKTWTESSNEIKHLNNSGNNFVIGLKPTNNIIYLNNAYDKNGGMAFSYYQNGVWSK